MLDIFSFSPLILFTCMTIFRSVAYLFKVQYEDVFILPLPALGEILGEQLSLAHT